MARQGDGREVRPPMAQSHGVNERASYRDRVRAELIRARCLDLSEEIKKANGTGLFVKVEFGLHQGSVEVYRGGSIGALDRDRAEKILTDLF